MSAVSCVLCCPINFATDFSYCDFQWGRKRFQALKIWFTTKYAHMFGTAGAGTKHLVQMYISVQISIRMYALHPDWLNRWCRLAPVIRQSELSGLDTFWLHFMITVLLNINQLVIRLYLDDWIKSGKVVVFFPGCCSPKQLDLLSESASRKNEYNSVFTKKFQDICLHCARYFEILAGKRKEKH